MKQRTQLKCTIDGKELDGALGIEIRIHLEDRKVCYYTCNYDCARKLLDIIKPAGAESEK